MAEPLILTLQLDETSQDFYEALRQRYFPPARNLIHAHLTLFHSLPSEDYVEQTVAEVAGHTTGFSLTDPGPRSIGRGVAVFFRSDLLVAMHTELFTAFQQGLIPQDRQRFRPHIVVQNKVDAETARRTLKEVEGLHLLEPRGIGLTLWRYLGGPWEPVGDFSFRTDAGT